LQNHTKSLLAELDTLGINKDKKYFIESRAVNVIQGAINLLVFIRENYSESVALELEKRFINSIRSRDPEKFVRGIKKIT